MRVERVVVGIDFSPASVDAARWVGRYFAAGAELVLAHVISIPDPSPVARSKYAPRELLIGTMREGAEKRLREISLSLGAARTWLEIREGDPVKCISSLADDFAAELVVTGAHGERGGMLGRLGSTADRLVRASTRPVLLVTKARLTTPRHMLVPLDKSDQASAALSWAGALGQQLGMRVTTLHVVTGGVSSGALTALSMVSGTPPVDISPPIAAVNDSNRWLEDVVAAGVSREQVNSEVAVGEPTHEIVAAAERLDVDLIVMGRRGSGKLRRAVLGSVVAGVLRNAPCPVLVVPEESGGS